MASRDKAVEQKIKKRAGERATLKGDDMHIRGEESG